MPKASRVSESRPFRLGEDENSLWHEVMARGFDTPKANRTSTSKCQKTTTPKCKGKKPDRSRYVKVVVPEKDCKFT